MKARSESALAVVHAGWMLRTTWRNGEQLLLVVGLPLAAFIALTWTDFLPGGSNPLAVVVAMVVLGAGFTSPAITIAFERRYGSYAFLGTTPMTRGAIVVGTLLSVIASALLAVGIIAVIALVSSGTNSAAEWPWLAIATILGLVSVVPWAFVLGGTIRSESVLVAANVIFVVSTLFAGVLIPASSLPYGALLVFLPPGAIMSAAAAQISPAAIVLVAWAVVGMVIARRAFRWR